MSWIDTHAHLYLEQFTDDIKDVIERCIENDITNIYLPNIDSSYTSSLHQLEQQFPNVCHAMMGLHPCSVKANYKNELRHIEQQLSKRSYAAVGEIGIDLYWDKSFAKEQQFAFEYQIGLAREHDLPFVIHSRDSLDITINTVAKLQNGNLKGIFHCFNGTADQGQRIIDLGFYLGIGGVVTFKNAGVAEQVSQLPLNSMVLETDAPYLSPVPYRGKRNESSYLIHIAEKLAGILEVGLNEVKKVTSKNADDIFGSYAKSKEFSI